METSQPLSIESFSYSWLVNLKPSPYLTPSLDDLDSSLRGSLDAYDEALFIKMDPRMPPSRRFFRNSNDFKFDFPISRSPLTLVHADELFSEGRVMPFFVNNSKKTEAYDVSGTAPTLPTSPLAPDVDIPQCKTNHHPSLRRCRRLSRRIFSKYLNFLRPLYRSMLRRSKSSGTRVESVDPRGHVRKNWLYSTGTSPRISVAYSADEWRKSCDSESSIYEAVLHCKKSIGK
ncbi:probable membrane-associated kinase regulator 6 [Hibiscus syriacus]|uniref:probable membrane-associated kinase regulator 6 n=1 Tax=Hibiscus syriacus TaxID=106335 RepID=UPI0019237FC8|nr:probable membrane-associated kinase regulator 6 [Hibiscus syriacus]